MSHNRLAQTCLALSLLIGRPAIADSPAFTHKPFAAARQQASQSHKWVMVDFYTTWCGPCKKLESVTWSDPAVIKWLQAHTVAIKVDAEAQAALSARYHIMAYPTILFLRADGTEADRLVGYRDPKTFLAEGTALLNGHDSLSRLKDKARGAGALNPEVRMQLAEAYAQRGLSAEALTGFLWCFDHGLDRDNGSFYGVRLSYLLSDIQELGASYPPALQALEKRRDDDTRLVTQGEGTPQQAYDAAAINDTLKQPERTLALYDALPKQTKGEIQAGMFREVLSQLVEHKRYQDVLDGAGDVDEKVRALQDQYNEEMPYFGPQGKHPDPETMQYLREHAVQQAAMYYEALLGSQKAAEAQAVADQLVAFDGSAKTWGTLMQHAVHAGDVDTAHRLADQGTQAIQDDQKGAMTTIIQQTFKSDPAAPQGDAASASPSASPSP